MHDTGQRIHPPLYGATTPFHLVGVEATSRGNRPAYLLHFLFSRQLWPVILVSALGGMYCGLYGVVGIQVLECIGEYRAEVFLYLP